MVGDALLYFLEPAYLRTGRGTPPSGRARTKLWQVAHVLRENSNFKFGIYLYWHRNFIVYVLKLMYLYISLHSVTLISGELYRFPINI